MSALGTPERPLRVAVIGSGPSGFYATESLLKSETEVEVDIFDRLPTPFGLVRYGVAPDHSKIKAVTKVYERIAQDARVRFFGHVRIGEDLSVEELKQFYDALIIACGAETDRALNIDGIDLPGSHTATEFVAWYNGHPDYKDAKFDLSQESVIVIGQGNVAIDVSRILCKTVDELKHTDIAQHALDQLAESRVKEIRMVGRRGPAQVAFTPNEIREFAELSVCEPVVKQKDLIVSEADLAEIEGDPQHKKNFEILRSLSELKSTGKPRKFYIDFFRSPMELLGRNRVEKVTFRINKLAGEAENQRAVDTGRRIDMDCGLFFRSIGYRGIALPGVPFREDWGTIPHQDGRVVDSPGGDVVAGMYCVGWIKRGPSGVIGTNKPDSAKTVAALLEDLDHLMPCVSPQRESVVEFLEDKDIRYVSYQGWQTIDAAEIARGEKLGKPREKFVSIEEMLNVL